MSNRYDERDRGRFADRDEDRYGGQYGRRRESGGAVREGDYGGAYRGRDRENYGGRDRESFGGRGREDYQRYGMGRDYGGEYGGRESGRSDYGRRFGPSDYGQGYDREANRGYGREGQSRGGGGYRGEGDRGYDDRPESLMGGGSTGYDPYYGFGSGGRASEGYSGRGAEARNRSDRSDFHLGYEEDRVSRAREREGRSWWDRVADEISSWFGDEEAERRKRRDNQTDKQYYRGRGPRGYRRSDERITEDVNDRLTDYPDLDASDIEVNVQNGEVVLTGTVDDRRSKRMAEALSESVSGVSNVENRLRVNRGDQSAQTSRSTAGTGRGTDTGSTVSGTSDTGTTTTGGTSAAAAGGGATGGTP
jgi:osmotically-inducible protein OsmY